MADDEGDTPAGPPRGVHRIEFETSEPPWHVAAYLLPGAEPVLVDTGVPGDVGWESLAEGMVGTGHDPREIDHVLVTHPHTDHDGLVSRLVETCDPTVYTMRAARDRLAMDVTRLADRVESNARATGLDEREVVTYVDQAVDSVRRNRECFPPETVDVALEPGETFDAGACTFEVIHTPGHQRDHACFAAADTLFAGDHLVEPFRAAALNVGLDDGVFASVADFYEGYRRLAPREFDVVYPGHGPVFEDFEGVVQASVESLDDLVRETAETLAERAPATAAAVNDARVDESWAYMLFETVGALGHLTERGRATFRVRDGVRYYEPT